jgi:chemotaxis protein methyltransferase CheR
VATAIAGRYPADRTDSVPKVFSRCLERVPGEPELRSIVAPVRSLVTFHQLNLLHDWPMRGPLDAIFCRNVLIYFDKETQRTLFRRYHGLLARDGMLFLGHSESITQSEGLFELLGKTIHRKREGAS